MRLVRISLAVKYRILFGAAVLLIIGAALCVPWYVLENLVLEQPFREAQRIADDYFQLAMANPGSAGGGVGVVHSKESGLLAEALRGQPQFIQLTANAEDPESILNQEGLDPFVGRAFRAFLEEGERAFLLRQHQPPQLALAELLRLREVEWRLQEGAARDQPLLGSHPWLEGEEERVRLRRAVGRIREVQQLRGT